MSTVSTGTVTGGDASSCGAVRDAMRLRDGLASELFAAVLQTQQTGYDFANLGQGYRTDVLGGPFHDLRLINHTHESGQSLWYSPK